MDIKKLNSLLLPFIILQLFSNYTIGQTEAPQRALLWEISKEGSSKKSYIYGTMHVSGKIAYHLGEEFFSALNSVDAVALESNPIIWLDEIFESETADEYIGEYLISNQIYSGFYEESFKLRTLDNKEWGQQLSSNHFLTNWMLYRENSAMKDFEEETFLDLFIYQAARKNNKAVYSLENFKQTNVFSNLAEMPDLETKERASWFKEMTEEKRLSDLIQDAYRNQDLDLMDSLKRESTTTNYMKYMLYERNYIMADKIDSLIQSDISLFIGIGAAHLPHTEGVINLLRKKGYTLRPIKPTINEKSKAEKERLSKMKTPISLTNTFKSELFTIKIPNKIYETPGDDNQREFFAPELTNGTFYTVNELSTYHYFKGDIQDNYLAKMDSLLFENIPGKIISKTEIEKDGFKGIDILNQTKSGDFQRYQIYVTPLKVLIFKMGGKDEYVKNNAQTFFNSITLTKTSDQWNTITSFKNDFKVAVPAFGDIKYNTHITSLYGHPELEAYDAKSQDYYFVKRASLYDFGYIEEDEFELFRIMDKFAEQFKIDSVFEKTILTSPSMPTATGWAKMKNNNYLNLKVIIHGAYYYLLVSVSSTQNFESRFFKSFQLQDFSYSFPFEQKTDSTLQFVVNSNYLKPNAYAQLYTKLSEQKRNKKEKEDVSYLSKNSSEIYFSENFERIKVDYLKYHTYSYYSNADSLWSRQVTHFMDKKSLILGKKHAYSKGDTNYFEVYFSDTNSSRIIYKKYIQFEDKLYTLTSQLDTNYKKSDYITTFYNTFKPYSNNEKQRSVFDDKASLFFDALQNGDSATKEIAYKSVLTHLTFKDYHVESLINVISNHSFPKEHINSKAQIIKDLGRLNDERIVPFLATLYKGMEDTTIYQVAVLRALANQKNKNACLTFIQLLEHDIPVGVSKDVFNYVFYQFNDSLELTKYLFPKLLDYTFVSEYKKPVYKLLNDALDSNALNSKLINKNYNQILIEAKMILKGQISYEQSELSKEKKRYYYSSYLNKGNEDLVMYSKMLMPFYKEKNVKAYFDKLNLVNDYTVRTQIACEFIKHKLPVADSIWYDLAEDPINYAFLYENLTVINRLDLFPKELINQEVIVKSLLYKSNFNFKTDSSVFVKKELVTLNGTTGYVYFFKSKKEKEEKWSLDYIGLQPVDSAFMNVNSTFKDRGNQISKGKDINELIEDHMKEIAILNRKRASENSSSYEYDYFDF